MKSGDAPPLKLAAPPARSGKASEFEDSFAFQCRARQLPSFERQYMYAKCLGRKFEADFCNQEYKLIVEINGGIWMKGGGAHSRPMGIENDYERHQYAARLGYFVLPFTTDDVTSGHAINWTIETLYKHGWRPQL